METVIVVSEPGRACRCPATQSRTLRELELVRQYVAQGPYGGRRP